MTLDYWTVKDVVIVSPSPVILIVYVPGVVFDPTFHVQLTTPLASDVFGYKSFDVEGPLL